MVNELDPIELDEAELVEELADTATIDQLMSNHVYNVAQWFTELIELSLQGNPVATHMKLLEVDENIQTGIDDLHQTLIELLAKRGDEFEVSGLQMTKVVIDGVNS